MGRLTFGLKSRRWALVLGDWNLERDSEPLPESFSLVFRKIVGRWVIVYDHTLRLME